MMADFSGGHGLKSQQRRLSGTDHGLQSKRVSSLDRVLSGNGDVRSPNQASLSHGTSGQVLSRSLSAERAGVNYHDPKIRGTRGSHLPGVQLKSSPVSSVGDYSPTGVDNHRERRTGSEQDIIIGRLSRTEGDVMHSEEREQTRRSSSKEVRTSLADDIHSIRIALSGASATAKERTLKTLERLTARLALAESERDVALGKCRVIILR